MLTGEPTADRARAAYVLANHVTSLSASQHAIDYADSIVLGEPPLRATLIARWQKAATESWLPPANFRPVPPRGQDFQKGSSAGRSRITPAQLKRAAAMATPDTVPHQLLRDGVGNGATRSETPDRWTTTIECDCCA